MARDFAHLALTALRAASERCSGVRAAATALPPFPAAFSPPSRPSSTAAGFFFLAILGSPSDQFIHDCFCLLNGIAPRFKVVHQIRIFLVKADGKESVLFFDREAFIVDWRIKFLPRWKMSGVVGIHLGVEVIAPLLQFFLTVLVSDWMPWIVTSDPAMTVEAKRNAVIEGVIAAIRFLNNMMAFDQSMYVLFAQAASSLTCQKGSFSDRARKRHQEYFVGSSQDHKAKNRTRPPDPAPIHESCLRLAFLLKARRSAGRWWSSDKADWKSVVVTWSGRRLYPLHCMNRLLLTRDIIPRTNIA